MPKYRMQVRGRQPGKNGVNIPNSHLPGDAGGKSVTLQSFHTREPVAIGAESHRHRRQYRFFTKFLVDEHYKVGQLAQRTPGAGALTDLTCGGNVVGTQELHASYDPGYGLEPSTAAMARPHQREHI